MRVAARPVRLAPPPKYRNRPTTVDGIRFASALEARQWGRLRLLALAGRVVQIERQPRFPLVVNGYPVGTYVADFRVTYADGTVAVQDCKGVRTPLYRLKRKLVRALYGFELVEVTA